LLKLARLPILRANMAKIAKAVGVSIEDLIK
jgi:hypothetical protein